MEDDLFRPYLYPNEIAAYEIELQIIADKYEHLFVDELDRRTGKKPMEIKNEVIINFSPLSIGFFKNTILPKYIINQITEAFKSQFKST